MGKDLLKQGLERHNIDIKVDYDKLEAFYSLLKEWNEKIDLTNIIEEDEVYIKHFLDCFTLFKIKEFNENKRLVDVGTGAGFPGLPLKLINDELDITLLDSLNKRLIFLDQVIEDLNLTGIRTLHKRGEDAGMDKNYRETFDIGTSRAVSRLNKLVELALPLIKPGGLFVAMKGKDILEEVDEAKKGIEILGGKVEKIIEFNLTEGENERSLVVIRKGKPTPKKYPRSFGKIKKQPL